VSESADGSKDYALALGAKLAISPAYRIVRS
jgi:hypothetical protein